jgi:hypothetical protein
MNDEMLNPNCSEVCWRLDLTCTLPVKEQICESFLKKEVDESDFDPYGDKEQLLGTFDYMLSTLQNAKIKKHDYKKIQLEFSDGGGGGGDYATVEDCFYYAMKVVDGEMNRHEVLRLLEIEEDENE